MLSLAVAELHGEFVAQLPRSTRPGVAVLHEGQDCGREPVAVHHVTESLLRYLAVSLQRVPTLGLVERGQDDGEVGHARQRLGAGGPGRGPAPAPAGTAASPALRVLRRDPARGAPP